MIVRRHFSAALLLLAASRLADAATTADPVAEPPWGEVVDGLQLQIDTGVNTESLVESQSLLYLSLTMRNVSDQPVFADFDQVTYDVEYEIDGSWYAFERRAALRTRLEILITDLKLLQTLQSSRGKIEPRATKWTMLTLPLAGRSTGLWLRAVTADGLGLRFQPTPGPHVVRVRSGRTLPADRKAPISNPVTLSFRIPAPDASSQSVSFVASRDASLRELQFTKGPADGQAFVRQVLDRPPEPVRVSRLITSAKLEVTDSIPYYELNLPRTLNAADPSLPTSATRFYYPVRASDQDGGYVGLEASPSGSAFNSFGGPGVANPDPMFQALQDLPHLAGMQQVRGGNYEPRLLQIVGVQGASQVLVFWLHSASGRPDIFYLPRESVIRGWTNIERGKLYAAADFLKAARTLPATPRHDAAWAVTSAVVCAKPAAEKLGGVLMPEGAAVEITLSAQQDRIVWYVYIPGSARTGMSTRHGKEWLVEDADGSCKATARERD